MYNLRRTHAPFNGARHDCSTAGRRLWAIPYNRGMRLFRLVKILLVALKYGLDEFLLGHERVHLLRATARGHLLARPVRATCTALATRIAGAGTDLRQVRTDALDASRSPAYRHRRR